LSPRSSTEPPEGRSGLALAGTIGGYVALFLLVGLGLGILLDKVLHTAPLFLIVGVIAGFIAGFVMTYRLAMGELGE
jgi:F0F1-type ATP synthase assembly protein I